MNCNKYQQDILKITKTIPEKEDRTDFDTNTVFEFTGKKPTSAVCHHIFYDDNKSSSVADNIVCTGSKYELVFN